MGSLPLDAMNMLTLCIDENAMPFRICREIPNADTIAALKEADERGAIPGSYKRYHSFSELLHEVAQDA